MSVLLNLAESTPSHAHVAPATLRVLEEYPSCHCPLLTCYQDSPLATNINYNVGQVQITVPNVPTRSDYIVVCKWMSCYYIHDKPCSMLLTVFGDSGNASPEFTIINDASSSTPAAPSSPPTSPPDPSGAYPPSPTHTAPPATTPHSSGPSAGSPTTHPGSLTSATTPASQTGSHTNTTVVVATPTTPPSSSSNAAWQRHVPSLATSLSVSLAIIYFAFS